MRTEGNLRFIDEEGLPELREFARPIWTGTFYQMMDRRSADYVFDAWVSVHHLTEMMSQGFRIGYILDNGETAGWFAFLIDGEGRLLISKLYLLPEFQHRGIGSRTLNEMMDIARREGATYAYLYVYRLNENALKTYLRNGFTEIRREVEELTEGVVRDDIVLGRGL